MYNLLFIYTFIFLFLDKGHAFAYRTFTFASTLIFTRYLHLFTIFFI